MDLTTPEGVVEYMENSSSEEDWDSRVEVVKRVNSGYPTFWYSAIIIPGIQMKLFGINGGIHVDDVLEDGTTVYRGTFDPVTHERID